MKWVKEKYGLWRLEGTGYTIRRVPRTHGIEFQIFKNDKYYGATTMLKESKLEIKELLENEDKTN